MCGPLGRPLAEPLTVEVRRTPGFSRGDDSLVEVLAVDGRRLDPPIRMSHRLWFAAHLDPREDGVTYRARAFQHGEFRGTPRRAMAETREFITTSDYYFAIEPVVFRNLSRERDPEMRRSATRRSGVGLSRC